MEQTAVCQLPKWTLLKNQLNNIGRSQIVELLSQKQDIIIIDVRTSREFNEFHIPNAINIDYLSNEFLDRLEQMDRHKKYLVYCRSGRRSVRSAILMKNFGFSDLIHLEGGIGTETIDF